MLFFDACTCGAEAHRKCCTLEGCHVFLMVCVFDLACAGKQQGGRVSRPQLACNFCINLQAHCIKVHRAQSALWGLKYNVRVNIVSSKCLCGISSVCVCACVRLCGLVCLFQLLATVLSQSVKAKEHLLEQSQSVEQAASKLSTSLTERSLQTPALIEAIMCQSLDFPDCSDSSQTFSAVMRWLCEKRMKQIKKIKLKCRRKRASGCFLNLSHKNPSFVLCTFHPRNPENSPVSLNHTLTAFSRNGLLCNGCENYGLFLKSCS